MRIEEGKKVSARIHKWHANSLRWNKYTYGFVESVWHAMVMLTLTLEGIRWVEIETHTQLMQGEGERKKVESRDIRVKRRRREEKRHSREDAMRVGEWTLIWSARSVTSSRVQCCSKVNENTLHFLLLLLLPLLVLVQLKRKAIHSVDYAQCIGEGEGEEEEDEDDYKFL